MTNYERGRRFEYRVRDDLRRRGWWVLRSPQSRSAVDLVALKIDRPALLVQAKMDGRLPPGEWNELWDLAETTGGVPVLVRRQGRRLEYCRLLERKDGSRRRQPLEVLGEDFFTAPGSGWE